MPDLIGHCEDRFAHDTAQCQISGYDYADHQILFYIGFSAYECFFYE